MHWQNNNTLRAWDVWKYSWRSTNGGRMQLFPNIQWIDEYSANENFGHTLYKMGTIVVVVKYTDVLREGNQTCVNVYDVIEMCAPAGHLLCYESEPDPWTLTLSPNTNPRTHPNPKSLTLFLTVTGTKFLKENKTGQIWHQNIGQHRVIFQVNSVGKGNGVKGGLSPYTREARTSWRFKCLFTQLVPLPQDVCVNIWSHSPNCWIYVNYICIWWF